MINLLVCQWLSESHPLALPSDPSRTKRSFLIDPISIRLFAATHAQIGISVCIKVYDYKQEILTPRWKAVG